MASKGIRAALGAGRLEAVRAAGLATWDHARFHLISSPSDGWTITADLVTWLRLRLASSSPTIHRTLRNSSSLRRENSADTCLMVSAWRASTSATALETACWICCCTSCGEGVTAATGANAVRTGTGAGRVAAKKIDRKSTRL